MYVTVLKVGVRAVVLSPTRELAMQTRHFFERLGKFTDLRSCLLLGGDSMDNQFADLAANPDVYFIHKLHNFLASLPHQDV